MTKKEQIIEFITNNIKNGTYKPGDRIISEYMLAETFNINRMTVRLAIDYLVSKGILYKIKGSGTYVCENYNTGKYIIISIQEDLYSKLNNNFYLRIIEGLKNKITEKNMIPHLFFEKYGQNDNHIIDNLKIPIKDVFGLISISGNENYYKPLVEKNIPCINIMNYKNHFFPCVNMNIASFVNKIMEISSKFKNPLLIIYNMQDAYYINNEYLYIFGKNEFLKKKIKYIEVDFKLNNKSIVKSIDKELNKLNFKPDLIIFNDDTLYSNSIPLFYKYDFFKDGNILTHSNNDEIYPEEFKITRLTYDINEYVNKSVELIFELNNKETLLTYGYNVDFVMKGLLI